jgi:hypothetical protein
MLAGTISQIAFVISYRRAAPHGCARAALAGCIAFAATTIALSFLHAGGLAIFALVLITLAAGYAISRRRRRTQHTQASRDK